MATSFSISKAPTGPSSTTSSSMSPGCLQDGDYLRVGNCIYRYLAGGNIEAEYHEEIYRLTILDGLTQIHNQRYMTEFLEREVVRSQRHSPAAGGPDDRPRPLQGDQRHLGHLGGDFVLRELANVIRSSVRKEDLFARYGGEEFVLVLVETDKEEAILVSEHIRQSIADHSFQFESSPINLTISVGVACMAGDMTITPSSLLKSADENLYQAKRTDGIALSRKPQGRITRSVKRAAPRFPRSDPLDGRPAKTSGVQSN